MMMLAMLLLGWVGGGAAEELEGFRAELSDLSYGNLWDRRRAAQRLGALGSPEASSVLLSVVGRGDPATREAVVLAVSRITDMRSRKLLLEHLPRLREPRARADMAWALGRMGWRGAADALAALLEDRSSEVRLEAVRALIALEDGRCARAVSDRDPETAEAAIRGTAELGADIGADLMGRLLVHRNGSVRGAALVFLAGRDRGLYERVTGDFLGTGVPAEAKMALADTACRPDILRRLLSDRDWRVEAAAIAGLERVGNREAIDHLIGHFREAEGRFFLDTLTALERVTGKDLGPHPENWALWWRSQRGGFAGPACRKKEGAVSKRTRAMPSFFGIPLYSRAVVFIIDVSGSMKTEDELQEGQRKIDVALAELEQALHGLPRGGRFNILLNSTEATRLNLRMLSPRTVPATQANAARAVAHVRAAWLRLSATNRGRGDVFDALLEAQADPAVDTVILLGDGNATDGRYLHPDHLVAGVKRIHRSRRATIHTVLTGSRGVNVRTMRRIAEATGGRFIPGGTDSERGR